MADLARHPDVVDLAEYAEGLLDAPRQSDVDAHVRECPDCTAILADLAGLPETLAQSPVPPMPPDVAARLDEAIAAEAAARATHTSSDSTVVPLRSRRRWLGPAVAAAAVIGAVAIAVPALDESGSDDSTASEAGSAGDSARDFEDGEVEMSAPEGAAAPVQLTSASFGRDVIDAYYSGNRDVQVTRQFLAMSEDSLSGYRAETRSIPGLCAPDGPRAVPQGQVDDITLDGEAAQLLRRDRGATIKVIAFTCEAEEPNILDAVTLQAR